MKKIVIVGGASVAARARRFNVGVRTQQEVIALDKYEKTVTVKNLVTNKVYQETYDKLVLSPGASPVIPPISGIVNPLTHTLRNLIGGYKTYSQAMKVL